MKFRIPESKAKLIHDLSMEFEGRVNVEFSVYTRGRNSLGCRDGESSGFTFDDSNFSYNRFTIKLDSPTSKVSDTEFLSKLHSVIVASGDHFIAEKIFNSISRIESYYGTPSKTGGWVMFGTIIPTLEQWLECLENQFNRKNPKKGEVYRFTFE